MRFICIQILAWSRIPLILTLSSLHISLILFLNSVQRYKKFLEYANFRPQILQIYRILICEERKRATRFAKIGRRQRAARE